jgi:hypothetical protein
MLKTNDSGISYLSGVSAGNEFAECGEFGAVPHCFLHTWQNAHVRDMSLPSTKR